MSFKVTYNKKELHAAMSKAAETALRAMGELMQDGLAANTHRQTGLLANSWNYRTKAYQSSFGDGPITNANQNLGVEEQASEPADKAVRTSSVLQYSIPYNTRFKVMEQTIDQNQSRLQSVASAAYSKEVGK